MACVITYNNKKYTQPEFNEYFKSHFFEFAGDFLGSKQDIEGFKDFINESNTELNINISTEVIPMEADLEGGEINVTIVKNGNQEIGKIFTENDGSYLTVFQTEIDGPKNSGTFAYIKLGEEALEKGLQLRSDRISDRMSEAAIGLWEKLVRNGYVEKVDDRYLFTGKQEESEGEISDTNLEEITEDNEVLTPTEISEEVDNELSSTFDELLANGDISQICN